MSSATFRRLGKIEQARGAIQEAEVRDESNPAVWVQVGLLHIFIVLLNVRLRNHCNSSDCTISRSTRIARH